MGEGGGGEKREQEEVQTGVEAAERQKHRGRRKRSKKGVDTHWTVKGGLWGRWRVGSGEGVVAVLR